MTHTQTPFGIHKDKGDIYIITGHGGHWMFRVTGKELAEFIVTACNAHGGLVSDRDNLIKALQQADQTLRNLAHGDLEDHSSEIAFNAATNAQKAYKAALKGAL